MSLYWFWFLFPTLICIVVMTCAMYSAQRNRQDGADQLISGRLPIFLWMMLGLPSLIPGWEVYFSVIRDYVVRAFIPASEAGSSIADFTVSAAMLITIAIHFAFVLFLIPVSLAKSLRLLRKA